MTKAIRIPWLLVYAIAYLVFLYLPVLLLPLFSFNDGTIVAFPNCSKFSKAFARTSVSPTTAPACRGWRWERTATTSLREEDASGRFGLASGTG